MCCVARVHLGFRSHGNSPSEIQRKGLGLLYEADQRLEDSMAEEKEATVYQRDGVGSVDSPLGEGRHCSDVS